MGQQGAGKQRGEPRTRAVVKARLRDAQGEREVAILDLSTRGLLALMDNPPKRGDFVEIHLGASKLAGQVKWSDHRRFGLSLREKISVTAAVAGEGGKVELAGSLGQQRRSNGHGAALAASPQMLARMFDLAVYGAAAVGAAYLIASIGGSAFAPLQDAVSHMNR